MENLEILKGVVSDDTYAKIEAETKDSDIKLADLSKGEYVSAGRVSGLEAQLERVNGALESKTAEYDALKEKVGDNQSLRDEIEQMKSAHTAEIDKLKTEYAEKVKLSAVAAEISTKYKPKDVADIMPYIDMAKVTVDGSTVTGLSEQIDPIKEKKPYLFGEDDTDPDSGKKKKGGINHEGGGNKEIDVSKVRAAFGIKEKENK